MSEIQSNPDEKSMISFIGFLSFNSFQDWLKAVRGFGILGIILLLIAVLGAFFRICLKERAWVLVLAIVLSFMAGNYKI